MTLITVEELSLLLSVPTELLNELIAKEILTPFGGKARLGEPRFSRNNINIIRERVRSIQNTF